MTEIDYKRYEVDENGCWIWQGAIQSKGYGCIWVDGRSVLAHRHYYEQLVGPISDGLQIDHLCRIKSCVNPEHLEPVTPQRNTHRGNRAKLSREIVEFIRASDDSHSTLAKKFGVTKGAIAHARRGLTWK